MDSVSHINSVVNGVRQKLLFSNLLWNWLQYNLYNYYIWSVQPSSIIKRLCFDKSDMRFHGNAFSYYISLQSRIEKWSLSCLSIMIFMEFMVMYGKKYQPFRLSTNRVKTSAVWLLDTLYFYVNFDNLFCLRAAVKQRNIFLPEMRPPTALYIS